MSQLNTEQTELCTKIALVSLEIRTLAKLMARDITEFDSVVDFHQYLDNTMEPIEFMGSVLKPSDMAKMTSDNENSEFSAKHTEWLEKVADKTELSEYIKLKSDYNSKREFLSKSMDELESSLPDSAPAQSEPVAEEVANVQEVESEEQTENAAKEQSKRGRGRGSRAA